MSVSLWIMFSSVDLLEFLQICTTVRRFCACLIQKINMTMSGQTRRIQLSAFRICWVSQEKGTRNHPLGGESKQLKRVTSAIRTCVEHVFCCMTMSMGGKLTRKMGLERADDGGPSRILLSPSFVISSAFGVLQWSHEFLGGASYESGELMRIQYWLLMTGSLLGSLFVRGGSAK